MCGGDRAERVPSRPHPKGLGSLWLRDAHALFHVCTSVYMFVCWSVLIYLSFVLFVFLFVRSFVYYSFVCLFSALRSVSAAWALVLKVDILSPSRIHMQVYAGVLGAPSMWNCGGLIDTGGTV